MTEHFKPVSYTPETEYHPPRPVICPENVYLEIICPSQCVHIFGGAGFSRHRIWTEYIYYRKNVSIIIIVFCVGLYIQ